MTWFKIDIDYYCLDEETNAVQFVDYWYHTSVEFEELLYVNGKVITVENPYHSRFMDEGNSEIG